MKSKWTSRKFLMSVASLLGSIATAIAGFATDSQMIILLGVICGVASAAIYEIVEAAVDCEEPPEVAEDQQIETITITAPDGTVTTTTFRIEEEDNG